MFSNVISLFKGVEVKTEPDGTVRILGMKTEPFLLAIDNLWKTSKISSHIFKRVRSHQLDLMPFFLPDFYYICKRLLGERRSRINRAAVQQVINQLETNTWLRSTVASTYLSKLNLAKLELFNLSPLPHQNDFLKRYDEYTAKWHLNGYVLGAVVGSGKTMMALFLSECMETDVTICIVPKPTVEKVWKDTLDTRYKKKPEYWYSTSGEEPTPGKRYYVAHYEQLAKMIEFFKRPEFKGKKINIVLDESHNLNEIKSARTELLIELAKLVGNFSIIWTSGTPLKAMGSEVIPLLRTIDPYFTPQAEEAFKKIYGLSSARGLDILAHRLGYTSFKVEKAQVMESRVEKFRVDVTIPNGKDYTLEAISRDMAAFIKERQTYYAKNKAMYLEQYFSALRAYERKLKTPAEIKEFEEYQRTAKILHLGYDSMIHKEEPILCNNYEKKLIIPNLPKEMRENFKNARSVYKYVTLKIQGEALGRVLSKKREQCNVDMLQAINDYNVTDLQTNEKFKTTLADIVENSVKKTLIFTSYVSVVDNLYDSFKAAGAYPLKVYGDNGNELPQIVTQFERDQRADPLIASLQSLSTGVPLIMANTVIFLNAPFRDYLYTQACARVDRLGQTEIVYIYDVFLDTGSDSPNISTRSNDIMAWSKSMVDQMLGVKMPDIAIESYDDVYDPIMADLPKAGVSESGNIDSLNPHGAGASYAW